jgi:hypothetical protein
MNTSIFRSVGTFARSSARNFVRRRTSGVLGSIDSLVTKSSMQIRSSTFSASVVVTTPRGNWITAILPGSVDWRRTIERYPNPIALVRRHFLPTRRDSSRGTNFSGGITQALRSRFTRYPLVPVSPKTTRGSLKCLVFSPIPFVASAHTEQHAMRNIEHAGKSVGEVRNV